MHCGDKHDKTTLVGENFDFKNLTFRMLHILTYIFRSDR